MPKVPTEKAREYNRRYRAKKRGKPVERLGIEIPSCEVLQHIAATYQYDRFTGDVSYKHEWTRTSRGPARAAAGVPLGCNHNGYLSVEVAGYIDGLRFRRKTRAHHIAWFLHYGEWPTEGMTIDHIDQNRTNNRIDNLRVLSLEDNARLGAEGRWGIESDLSAPSMIKPQNAKRSSS